MRVAMVMPTLSFPGELRADTEIRALREAGIEVEVLAAGVPDLPDEEVVDGIRVRRVSGSPTAMRLSAVLLKLTSYRWHPLWKRPVREFVSGGFDVVHVHELKPFRMSERACRRAGVPVVLDLREDYPEQAKGAGWTLDSRLFNSIRKIERAQRRACRLADAVLVVSPMFIDVFASRYPEVGREKFTLVSNYADVDAFNEIVSHNGKSKPDEAFTITYVGTIGNRARGIQTAIAAMPRILEVIPGAMLRLVGGGGYVNALVKKADRLSVRDRVIFEGQVEFERVPGFIQRSSVCIVPSLNETYETDMALPYKLFQYMLLERPVVVSNCHELERVVTESGAGLVFEAGDADDFADKVIALKDPDARARFGARGRRAVLEQFNFAADAKRLAVLLRRLGEKKVV